MGVDALGPSARDGWELGTYYLDLLLARETYQLTTFLLHPDALERQNSQPQDLIHRS